MYCRMILKNQKVCRLFLEINGKKGLTASRNNRHKRRALSSLDQQRHLHPIRDDVRRPWSPSRVAESFIYIAFKSHYQYQLSISQWRRAAPRKLVDFTASNGTHSMGSTSGTIIINLGAPPKNFTSLVPLLAPAPYPLCVCAQQCRVGKIHHYGW